jgi:hypothetical protein
VVVTATAGIVSFMADHVSALFFETDVAFVVSHWREKALSAGNAFHARHGFVQKIRYLW